MRTIEDLITDLDMYGDMISEKVNHFDPGDIMRKGEELTAIIGSCSNVAAEIEKMRSLLMKAICDEQELFKKPHTQDTREIILEAELAELNYQKKRADGYVKAMYSTLEWYRTVMSYLKMEREKGSQFGNVSQ